jgi:hypothetical protein
MAIGVAAIQAIVAGLLLVLSLVFTGVVSRPMVVAGAVLLVLAALSGRRELRRQLRVFAQQQQAVAAVIALVVVGLVGFWALLPGVQRHLVLGQLEKFTEEGRQIQDQLSRAGGSQFMGDYTARVQDWHQRLEVWVGEDLGPFFRQRLGTPPTDLTYPPQLPNRLRIFWDRIETDLGAMELFRKEYSSWLFKPGV